MSARTPVVWCCDWPLVAAGVPPDEPAVIVHANRVIAASPAARDEGVEVGLRRREAQGRPDLTVLPQDPARRPAVRAGCGRGAALSPSGDHLSRRVRPGYPRSGPLPGRRGPCPAHQRRGPRGAGRHRPRLLPVRATEALPTAWESAWPTSPSPPASPQIDFRQPAQPAAAEPRPASLDRARRRVPGAAGAGAGAARAHGGARAARDPHPGRAGRLGPIRPRGPVRGRGRGGSSAGLGSRGPSAPRPPPSPELVAAELDPPAGRPTKRRSWARGWPTSCTSAWTSGGWRARGWRWRSRPNTASASVCGGRGGADGSRRGRSGPLAARRVAAGAPPIVLPPASSASSWYPTRSCPPRAVNSGSGAARPRRPSGRPGPWLGWWACWVRRRCGSRRRRRPFTGRAGGAGARRRRRFSPSPASSPLRPAGRALAGACPPLPRRLWNPSPARRRWSTPGDAPSASAARGWSMPARRVSVAGESWAEVAGWAGPWPLDERWWDGCTVGAGPVPDGHRRRRRPPPVGRGRPLVVRSCSRLTAAEVVLGDRAHGVSGHVLWPSANAPSPCPRPDPDQADGPPRHLQVMSAHS